MSSLAKTYGGALVDAIEANAGSDGFSLGVSVFLDYAPNVETVEIAGTDAVAIVTPMRGSRSRNAEGQREIRQPFRVHVLADVRDADGDLDDDRIEYAAAFVEELLEFLEAWDPEGADLESADYAKGGDEEPLLYKTELGALRFVQRLTVAVVTDAED